MPPKKDNLTLLLFLAWVFTGLTSYGGLMVFDPYGKVHTGTIVILGSAAVGFLATCGLAAYSGPEWKPYSVGFLFGLVPAHLVSLAIGVTVLLFLLGNADFLNYIPMWGVCIVLGSAVWALAAIPTCALFRRLIARLRKD